MFSNLDRLRPKRVVVGLIPQHRLDLLSPSSRSLLMVAAAVKALTTKVVVISKYGVMSYLFLNSCTLCFSGTKHFNLSHCSYLKCLCKLCW
jgi:hypothetical protein